VCLLIKSTVTKIEPIWRSIRANKKPPVFPVVTALHSATDYFDGAC